MLGGMIGGGALRGGAAAVGVLPRRGGRSCVLISVGFEQIAIRPLLRKGVLAQIIATVGASFVFETAAMLIWGRDAVTLPAFSGEKPISVGGATIVPQTLWVVGLTVVIVVGAAALLSQEPVRQGGAGLRRRSRLRPGCRASRTAGWCCSASLSPGPSRPRPG